MMGHMICKCSERMELVQLAYMHIIWYVHVWMKVIFIQFSTIQFMLGMNQLH